jgi:hypothetical protein
MAKRAIEVGDSIWLRAEVVNMTRDGEQVIVKIANCGIPITFRADGIDDANIEKAPPGKAPRDRGD